MIKKPNVIEKWQKRNKYGKNTYKRTAKMER